MQDQLSNCTSIYVEEVLQQQFGALISFVKQAETARARSQTPDQPLPNFGSNEARPIAVDFTAKWTAGIETLTRCPQTLVIYVKALELNNFRSSSHLIGQESIHGQPSTCCPVAAEVCKYFTIPHSILPKDWMLDESVLSLGFCKIQNKLTRMEARIPSAAYPDVQQLTFATSRFCIRSHLHPAAITSVSLLPDTWLYTPYSI